MNSIYNLLLLILCLSRVSVQQRLLISKKFNQDYLVAGRELDVIVDFHNIDNEPAKNVKCKDFSFEDNDKFELVHGNFEHEFKEILGNSNASYTFTVIPKSITRVLDQPAVVEYLRKGKVQIAKSSAHMYLNVISESEYLAKYADHFSTWIVYGIASSAVILGHLYLAKK